MIRWYFKDGTLAVDVDTSSPKWMSQMKRLDKLLADPKYKQIAEDTVGKYWVSTVWVGLDYSFSFFGAHRPSFFGAHRPLIFETIVFEKPFYKDLDLERYSTKEEALKGHKKMVKKWSKK